MTPRPRYLRGRGVLGLVTVALSLLSAGVAGWAASFPSGAYTWGLLAVGLALVAAAVWLSLGVLCVLARRFHPALVVPILIGAVGLVAVRFDLPLRARFAVARPAFERVILDRGDGGPEGPCPGWVGSYRIQDCTTTGTVTLFRERDGGFLNGVGFAYAPDGHPALTAPEGGAWLFTQLDGSWFTFVAPW